MNALSLAGLLASLAPAAIAAWRDPARDPELWLAFLTCLALGWLLAVVAIFRLPNRSSARTVALLVHVLWALVAVIVVAGAVPVPAGLRNACLLLPAGFHAARLSRRPRALHIALALQIFVLTAVSWTVSEPAESTPSVVDVARAGRYIMNLPVDAPFPLYLQEIAGEDNSQLRDVMVEVTVSRVSGVEEKLIAALQAPESRAAALLFLESEKAPCNERLAGATAAVGVNLRACPVAP